MEGLLILVGFFLVYAFLGTMIKAIFAGVSSGVETLTEGGSLKDNFLAKFRGMGPFEIRVEDEVAADGAVPIWRVYARGIIPVTQPTRLGIAVSVIDGTVKGNPLPVLSALDDFQEPDTRAFSLRSEVGICEPNQGFAKWVPVVAIPKDLLLFPKSGQRSIHLVLRLVDVDNPPAISLGMGSSADPGIVITRYKTIVLGVGRGFLEKSEEELAIAVASVRIAMGLGMADGTLDRDEALIIRKWVQRFISEVPEGQAREEAKEHMNEAMKWALEDVKMKSISISDQMDTVNRLAGNPEKYALMDLCLDVMAADGKADSEELRILQQLCSSLGLDFDKFQEMKDKRLISVEKTVFDGQDIWGLLGIQSDLSNEEKLKKLNRLYAQWNSRSEALESGEERDKAQEMLDLIVRARQQLKT